MLLLSVSLGIPFHEIRNWSSAEILLYQCYYRIAPWGEERADLRNAMSMSMTANMHRDSTRNPKPFEYSDFMPFAERKEDVLDTQTMKETFSALARRKR